MREHDVVTRRQLGDERHRLGSPAPLPSGGLWGIDDPAFVERVARFVRTHQRVELLAYFNGDTGSTWDLSSKPRSLRAYRRAITPLGR